MPEEHKDRVARLIEEAPFDIRTDWQVTGRRPTIANSAFLTNKQQGDWAEQLALQAINNSSPEHVDNRKYLQFAGERRRKQHCQYFTPPEVASFMVDWVSGSGLMSIFDPAFGLGAFFYSASKDRSLAFAGCEIDSCILDYWKNTHKGNTDFVENGDYLLSWNNCYENIVCNPPYMRFQKFHNRDAVSNAFQKHLNLRLPGYTNAASAFLIKSLSELSKSGRLAYIMPLEFLNTRYGAIVKERLMGITRNS